MELHEIRYFLALCETLNFTRAAEACNVTQPALTRAIKSLEDKLGGRLIHRERGNTHLTELGRMMQPYFGEIFSQMEEARRRAQSFVKLKEATLTVGLMCTIGPSKLIDLFGAFNEHYQGVELYLRDGAASQLEEQLIRGEIDLAIYCKPQMTNDALHMLPLFSERFVIGLSPNHPLARLSEIKISDLEGHDYLSRINCEYRDYIRDFREELGVSVRRPYASERDDWIQSMVLAGLGFTVIPEYAVTLPGLTTRPFVDPEFVRRVGLVTVRGRPHSPAVGAFVHECRRYPWAAKMCCGMPESAVVTAA
ncbi:LysR family transcriptional regulator [Stappia sp. F7233]|uniref:LysR family transcriptional regulator n=1 Tax=Stappia albiluteola TaxID=2758565 RepID=A0A839AD76_9HYPH|nr:LysR family transcriptional regulator [Stappia albiluteola]MBA5777096.1 LysR family transcriptional regulator [Stappia albiluteola]